jgi:hypothetical protein
MRLIRRSNSNRARLRRWVAGVTLTVLVCSISLITAAGPASAAGGDWLYTPGGQGYASWTWSSSNYANITAVTKVAWDTDCDDDGMYTYMVIYQTVSSYTGSRVGDSCSGGQSSTTGGSFSGSNNIKGIRVYVCEDTDGSDWCANQYYDSPYT